MSKRKPVIVVCKSDVYPHTVVFYIGEKPDDATVGRLARRNGLWNGKGKRPTVGSGGAATVSFGDGSIVWLNRNSDRFMSQFAHEMVHVLNNLSDQIGEKQTYMNDELFAYFAGWLAKKLFKRIRVKLS